MGGGWSSGPQEALPRPATEWRGPGAHPPARVGAQRDPWALGKEQHRPHTRGRGSAPTQHRRGSVALWPLTEDGHPPGSPGAFPPPGTPPRGECQGGSTSGGGHPGWPNTGSTGCCATGREREPVDTPAQCVDTSYPGPRAPIGRAAAPCQARTCIRTLWVGIAAG